MAVYTLPKDMLGFFKKNIAYITEHSIDPDKRRYATKHEGVRHYIDIDHWGKIPFDEVPRDFEEAIIKHCTFRYIEKLDTFDVIKRIQDDQVILSVQNQQFSEISIDYPTFLKYWKRVIKPMYYEDEWKLSGYDIDDLFTTNQFQGRNGSLLIIDNFSPYGIIPYHLESMLDRMTKAFIKGEEDLLLRIVSEFGHYVGDAHVPLHTTKNYNGQLSNQLGIHAFWESRIPELFAETDYDFFVGTAQYIENPREYIWDIIIKSHSHLDSVLAIELRLSKEYEQDRQFCFDERLNQTIRIQCREYAAAYSRAMGTMVEDQMRGSVKAIGDFWFTAWVNAGQPDLNNLSKVKYVPEVVVPNNNVKARSHDNE